MIAVVCAMGGVNALQLSALTASVFADVPDGHAHAAAIEYLQAHGIVSGYADGSFRPEATLNRAEFVKIALEAVSLSAEAEQCVSRFHETHGPSDAFCVMSCRGRGTRSMYAPPSRAGS